MESDSFTEIGGMRVGRRFELAPGVTHYFVASEGGVSLQPTRPFSLMAVLEPASGGWDLSVPAGGVRIVVKEIDDDRETDQEATGKRVRIEDSHVVCIHPRPGSNVPETKWLYQRAGATEPEEEPGDQDGTDLYSSKTGLILSRKKIMAIRAVWRGNGPRTPSPLETWGFTNHPLRKDLDHVFDLIEVDPAVSLRKGRRLLKGALRARYRAARGDPGDLRVGQLLSELEARALLPAKVASLAKTILDLSSAGGEPIVPDEGEPAREAQLALWCLTLFLEWHQRSFPKP